MLLLSTNAILPKQRTPISSGAVPDPSWCQVGLRTLATQLRQASLLSGPDMDEHSGQDPLRTLNALALSVPRPRFSQDFLYCHLPSLQTLAAA